MIYMYIYKYINYVFFLNKYIICYFVLTENIT